MNVTTPQPPPKLYTSVLADDTASIFADDSQPDFVEIPPREKAEKLLAIKLDLREMRWDLPPESTANSLIDLSCYESRDMIYDTSPLVYAPQTIKPFLSHSTHGLQQRPKDHS